MYISINYRLIVKVAHASQMLRARRVLVPTDTVAFVRRDIMEMAVNWVRKNGHYMHSWYLRYVLIICNLSFFIHLTYLYSFDTFSYNVVF